MDRDSSIQIAVACHKPYRIPEDKIYLPIQVGATLHPELSLGFQKDDEGDNISEKNGSYCELTALWWLWKNCRADYKGLVHYRRHFRTLDYHKAKSDDSFERIATTNDIRCALSRGDVVLPKKRNYYIETVYSHYDHTFDASQFDVTRQVMSTRCPKYIPAWDSLMDGNSAHLYNMFVMSATLVNSYCEWLFPFLAELEDKIDSSGMDAFQARWPGRVSERLFNAWVDTNNLSVVEMPTVSPEPVDWFAKGTGFLAAKFLGKKYKESF